MALPTIQSITKGAMSASKKPLPPSPMTPSYKAEAVPTSLPQFAMQRQQAQSRLQGQGQLQQDALNRRFAQLGGGPSGAAIKAQQNLGAEQAMQQEDVMGGINAQELGALQALQEAEKGRVFESGQADVARQMQADQFGKQFGLSERELALSKRQIKSQEAADRFNRAIAASELKGDKLKNFQNYYNSPNALSRRIVPNAAEKQAQKTGMVQTSRGWEYPSGV